MSAFIPLEYWASIIITSQNNNRIKNFSVPSFRLQCDVEHFECDSKTFPPKSSSEMTKARKCIAIWHFCIIDVEQSFYAGTPTKYWRLHYIWKICLKIVFLPGSPFGNWISLFKTVEAEKLEIDSFWFNLQSNAACPLSLIYYFVPISVETNRSIFNSKFSFFF